MFRITVKQGPSKLNLRGFRTLRTSPGAKRLVGRHARAWAAAAGPGFVAKESPSSNRARWVVAPDTPAAQKRDLTDLVLLRTINAARRG